MASVGGEQSDAQCGGPLRSDLAGLRGIELVAEGEGVAEGVGGVSQEDLAGEPAPLTGVAAGLLVKLGAPSPPGVVGFVTDTEFPAACRTRR